MNTSSSIKSHAACLLLLAQVIVATAIVLCGAAYAIRCLLNGQPLCALCFALAGYVAGYRLLFRTSLDELRRFNAQKTR